MNRLDCLKLLGLTSGATDTDIKSAYRRLAMKYHPDRNPNDSTCEEKFKEIKNAYEYLLNKNSSSRDTESSGFKFNDFSDVDDSFDDIFSDFFGSYNFKRGESNFSETKDSMIRIDVDLRDAAKGFVYSSFIPFWRLCSRCFGNKYLNTGKQSLCFKCKGCGYINTSISFIRVKQSCNYCNGRGKNDLEPCYTCSGLGKVKEREYISVDIPKGVTNGYKVKVVGKGELYNLKKKLYGDLYLDINIKKDKCYVLDSKYNIHYDLKISLIDSLLGANFIVKTLYKDISVSIDGCVDIYKPLVYDGFGYYLIKSNSYTNFIIHLKVVYPSKLNRKQYILLDKFKYLLK